MTLLAFAVGHLTLSTDISRPLGQQQQTRHILLQQANRTDTRLYPYIDEHCQ